MLQPLSDIVFIRRQSQQEISEGGVYLPPSEDFREDIGTIVACGPGKVSPKGVLIPMDVKIGDKVIFSTNGHQITKIKGEELVVTRQNSIMGVIDGEDVHSFSIEQEGY